MAHCGHLSLNLIVALDDCSLSVAGTPESKGLGGTSLYTKLKVYIMPLVFHSSSFQSNQALPFLLQSPVTLKLSHISACHEVY